MKNEIIGFFDGEHMVSEDGKRYPVPGNYASRSMLVQGDQLKLIMEDGNFIYKQLKKVERQRAIMMVIEEDGRKRLINDKGRTYGILSAAVSFFNLNVGDEVIAIIPREADTYFAAVEMATNK
jgi:hypothetical protein